MAKTREIRRRIRSVRNTLQLTKAMKMVSAAKLRRAHERLQRARPFSRRLVEVLRSLATRVDPEAHPLLRTRQERRLDVLVLSGDRGLCGSFNSNVLKHALSFLGTLEGRDVSLQPVGRKGREFFRRRRIPADREWVDVFRDFDFPLAEEIADPLIDRYAGGQTDAVYVVYNEFKSAIQQRPVVERLLPVEPVGLRPGEVAEDYLYEPDPKGLFDALLPKYVEYQIFRALLESNAAEQAARMTAMDSATKNAGELIDSLTLHMNRVRQASITTEIIEVVSGSEALG